MSQSKQISLVAIAVVLALISTTTASAGLVAYFPLDGNADAVVGPDGAINGSPGTVAGQVGMALDLNGSSDFVDVGAGVMPGGSYSIAAWVKPDTTSGIQYVGGVQNSGQYGGRLFRLNGAVPEIQHITSPPTSNPGTIQGKPGTAVGTTGFVHLVATFNDDANELRFYQDGTEVGSPVSVTNNSNYVRENFKIGRRPDGGGANFFNGIVDDVAVYSHALAPQEVDTVYNSGVLSLEAQRAAVGLGVRKPYQPDADTLHLFHLDATTGDYQDTGSGTPKNLDLIGGTRGTFAPAGFGGALTVTSPDLGNNALTKGATTAAADAQSLYQGADGAFTYEALLSVSTLDTIASEQIQILSREGDGGLTSRSFQFRIINGSLEFIGLNNSGPENILAPIPTAGEHAFVPNEWFHVAVTYDGDPSNPDNLSFYWTRLQSSATEANSIGTGQLTADLAGSETGIFSIGSMRRGGFRTPLLGSIDEVRISGIARGPGDFIFAIPEPSTLVLFGLGMVGLAAFAWRRRR